VNHATGGLILLLLRSLIARRNRKPKESNPDAMPRENQK
jgi:hypothetical protein